MTHDDAIANYEAARRRFGDACLDPTTTHDKFEQAQQALREAARTLRGFPRTLAGITNAGRTA
jgi:hypothetical protein